MSDNSGQIVGRAITNPFGDNAIEMAARHSGGGLISVEQQRAVAEVQARMIIARSNPRDPIRCMDLILQDCTRPTLAEGAVYQYARGGTSISGPSIRLAESIARRWGNVASGIKEISRNAGYSECVAYAWDLETGFYDERQFQVRHWRDTKGGGYVLTDERDIYELTANLGQRRKRAVLLSVIPGDVVEAAVQQCEETLRTTADVSPEAIKKMIQFFGAYEVSKEQIEAFCQCRAEAIRPAQIVRLRKIYASLKDGMSEPSDWFAPVGDQAGQPKSKLDRFEQQHSQQQTTVVEEDQPEPFLVIEANGQGAEVADVDRAVALYRAALVSAEETGEAAMTKVWENNGAFMTQLEERGHADLSKQLSTEYGQLRQAIAEREAAASKPDTNNLAANQEGEGRTEAATTEAPAETQSSTTATKTRRGASTRSAEQPEAQTPPPAQENPAQPAPPAATSEERSPLWAQPSYALETPTKQDSRINFPILRDQMLYLLNRAITIAEIDKFVADNEVNLRRLRDAYPNWAQAVDGVVATARGKLAGGSGK